MMLGFILCVYFPCRNLMWLSLYTMIHFLLDTYILNLGIYEFVHIFLIQLFYHTHDFALFKHMTFFFFILWTVQQKEENFLILKFNFPFFFREFVLVLYLTKFWIQSHRYFPQCLIYHIALGFILRPLSEFSPGIKCWLKLLDVKLL